MARRRGRWWRRSPAVRPRLPPAGRAAPGRAAGPSAPRPRLTPSSGSAASTRSSSPSSERGVEGAAGPDPDRPLRTPSSASSCSTIAALGAPMPVDWIVSGRCPRGLPGVAPEPAVVVVHQRLVQQQLGKRHRPAGVARAAGRRGRSGRSAAEWIGTAANATLSARRDRRRSETSRSGISEALRAAIETHLRGHRRLGRRRPASAPPSCSTRSPAAAGGRRGGRAARPGGRRRGRPSGQEAAAEPADLLEIQSCAAATRSARRSRARREWPSSSNSAQI